MQAPMKVTVNTLRSLAVGAACVIAFGLSAGGAFAAEKSQQPSAKLQKPLHEVQDLLKAKKYTEAIAKLKDAEAIGGKSAYDQHVINEFLVSAYINTQNYGEAAKALEAELNDGFTPESEKAQMYRAAVETNYQVKNYDKVIELGNQAIKAGSADDRMRTMVGQAYYLKGDYKGALKFWENYVDQQVKAGQTPKKEAIQIYQSSCQKMNDNACVLRATERLVAYYPDPDSWSVLLYGLRQQASGNDPNLLQTYRLMNEVNILKNPGDYNEMAQLALESGSPGEAQSVLQKGFDKGVFDGDKLAKDRNTRLLENAKKAAASDQAALPKLTSEADSASNGAKNVGVGIAYLGYGQYDKAIDELSKGLQKGGVKDENQARLLLGIAQLKGGHKDDAVKTFKSVKGDETLERLANLWQLHAKQA